MEIISSLGGSSLELCLNGFEVVFLKIGDYQLPCRLPFGVVCEIVLDVFLQNMEIISPLGGSSLEML